VYETIGHLDFRTSFQFDVRGTNRVFGGTNIELIAGEIKSGADRKYAIIQVIERLLILRKALMCIANIPSNNIHLRGEVFTNTREWKHNAPTTDKDLVSIMQGMAIKQSTIDEIFPTSRGSNTFLTIDIEVIGYG